MTMTTQIVTALELTAERPEMVRSIIELIMADTIATLVESEESYSHLHDLFIRSGEDIVENYKDASAFIDLSNEYRQLLPLVDQLIDNIGADLFTDMCDADESSALSEVLRCFGHGTSFWDNHNYQDFGFNEIPELKTTLESPYDIAYTILDKIVEREILNYMFVDSQNDSIPDADRFDYLVREDEPNNVTTFKIPSHYLSLIFNGDASGVSEEELEAWKQFEQQMIADRFTNGYWSYPDNTESYFSYSNDVHNLGDNVVDLQWVDMS